ncbi:DUF3050 domain-containing protein [Planctomicrobium sp. SH664]|uniref:DUF3050 domain-containing protein n=1 Tax=Planctomicrobium sp. SH664 TaxID=3448125 RepID=UPI003F5B86D0
MTSDEIDLKLKPLQQQLLTHSLYSSIQSRQGVALFMREHVFAVWDFMSLLKRLQRELCGTGLPWVPPRHASLARFVNEIVLAEESDLDGAGGHISHFELYLQAMREVGADTAPIQSLLSAVETVEWSARLQTVPMLPETRAFVSHTLEVAERGSLVEVAAAFCYGREDIIPQMFSRLLTSFQQQSAGYDRFQYYLERHVELDGDEHGPLARRLVSTLCAGDSQLVNKALAAARRAIELRIQLWDGILRAVRTLEGTASSPAVFTRTNN